MPSDDEWKSLEMHLGMSPSEADATGYRGTDEGKKLKSTSGWNYSGNGTDAMGFKALPGGYCSTTEDFYYLGDYGYWWSATTAISSAYAWYRLLTYDTDEVNRSNGNKAYGFSVRCVRD